MMNASRIDPVVELAELLVVTRRFRDEDLTLEDARHILAMVRERAHRALIGLPLGEAYPPQLFESAKTALQAVTREETVLVDKLEDALSPQVVKRLNCVGVRTFADLAQMTRAEIEDLPVGRVMVDSIAEHLSARGLMFKAPLSVKEACAWKD